MYLSHTTRRKDGKVHRYWRLVRSVARGRQGGATNRRAARGAGRRWARPSPRAGPHHHRRPRATRPVHARRGRSSGAGAPAAPQARRGRTPSATRALPRGSRHRSRYHPTRYTVARAPSTSATSERHFQDRRMAATVTSPGPTSPGAGRRGRYRRSARDARRSRCVVPPRSVATRSWAAQGKPRGRSAVWPRHRATWPLSTITQAGRKASTPSRHSRVAW
jgi:hypothetical protein